MQFFAENIPESVIKNLSIRVKKIGGINFGQGIPSFPTAEHIRDAARLALTEKDIGVYPNFLGNEELRDAIAKKFSLEFSQNFTIDHVLITVGAMEAVASTILSLVNSGEKVGIITPDYCNHFPVILLAKGIVIEIPMQESDVWQLDLNALETAAKSGLKVLLVTNPSNPTGAVLTRGEVERIVGLSNSYGFWLVFDETYSFLTYDGLRFTSLTSYFEKCERIIVIRSFSKEYAMTGWRVGYLVTRPETVKLIARTHDTLVGCVTKISQRAAFAAITGPQNIVTGYREILSKRREVICQKLDHLKNYLSFAKPLGAYYIFLKYSINKSSMELCEEILQKAHVAVVPGAAFGISGESHFRISYAVEDQILKEGLEKIVAFFNDNTAGV